MMQELLYLVLVLLTVSWVPKLALACGPKCKHLKVPDEGYKEFYNTLDEKGCACGHQYPKVPSLFCNRADEASVLSEGMKREVEPGQPLREFRLVTSSLQFFPPRLFRQNPPQSILLVNSGLLSLTSLKMNIFEGAEESLENFTVVNNPFVSAWNFSNFSGLKNLKVLNIIGGAMRSFDKWRESLLPRTLTHLDLFDNHLKKLEKRLFSDLPLTSLKLGKNHLKSLPDAFLPSTLKKFDISRNRLLALPKYFLDTLPLLEELNLEQNVIMDLDPRPFLPIMLSPDMRDKLKVRLAGNPLDCCRLSWYIGSDLQTKNVLIGGRCAKPDSLRTVRLHSLFETDFVSKCLF